MSASSDRFEQVSAQLKQQPKKWLVTGCAGFIGSNLIEWLLKHDQVVVGLDNFSTGFRENLAAVEAVVGDSLWGNFQFIEGDIVDLDTCHKAVASCDYVLHQAALGSVPRSIENPVATNAANISGFLNMLTAAKEAEVSSFTYAASSSTYGDHPALPKLEPVIGNPLSPYAVTKYVNELYADVFKRCYGFASVGLRYFNVFGYRQNPNGAYAAVIPKWIQAIRDGDTVFINGDGETSRDFCFIDNAVQANILAATVEQQALEQGVYNIAYGQRTSLNQLHELLNEALSARFGLAVAAPVHRDFRAGDVRHSLASIEQAKTHLGYKPRYSMAEGIQRLVASL